MNRELCKLKVQNQETIELSKMADSVYCNQGINNKVEEFCPSEKHWIYLLALMHCRRVVCLTQHARWLFTSVTIYFLHNISDVINLFFLHLVSSSPSLTFLTLANSKQTNKHAHTRVDLVGRQPQNDLIVWLNSQHKFFSSFCNTKLRG